MRLKGSLYFFLVFAIFLLFMGRVRIAPPDLAFYYSFGRSITYDLDYCFANEYDHFTFGLHETYLTRQGYPANDWPMGTGIVWIPFFLLPSLLQGLGSIFGLCSNPNGFNYFHQWIITYGSTLVFGAGTLILSYRITRYEGLDHSSTLWSCALLALGSTLTYHLYVNSADSHPPSAFFIALFIYQWIKSKDALTPTSCLLPGFWLGIAALIRPHNAIFILTPLLDHLLSRKKINASFYFTIGGIAIVCLLTFLPQMMVWKVLYGSWLELPRSEDVQWLQPHLWKTLFSDFHGMISWSPLFGLGMIGLFCRKRWMIYWVPVLIQLYVYSCNIAWWSGGSFGNRRMVGCVPLFILGLAFLLHHIPRIWLKIFTILCAIWTFLLLNAEVGNTIALDHYMAWSQILQAIPDGFLPGLVNQFPAHEWTNHFFEKITGVMAVLLFFTIIYLLWKKYQDGLKKYASQILIITLIAFLLVSAIAMKRTYDCRGEYDLSGYIPYDRFSWTIYYEKGFYQAQTGKPFEAMESLLAAAILEPRHPQAWMYLGIICHKYRWHPLDYHLLCETFLIGHRTPYFLQNFEKSISHMMDTGSKPLHRLYNQRGVVYGMMGDYARAERDFTFSLQLKSDFKPPRKNLNVLQQRANGIDKPFYWS